MYPVYKLFHHISLDKYEKKASVLEQEHKDN